ncbi:MAG: hypothetical protein JO261_11885 [Alphaproteobacteria bacterium]|nr:hypothetical protein [Alphaproteobacteria bacterium]MBV9694390.1 hypothetical protein [Alphaproteobacteria bacterium]
MAKQTAKPAGKAPHAGERLRESVYAITSQMEEPLRHATQMVRLIGLVDPREDEDKEAIGFVAHEAGVKLQAVTERLRALFAACSAGSIGGT